MQKIKEGIKMILYGIFNPIVETLIFCLPQNKNSAEVETAILSGILGFLLALCIAL